MIPNALAAVLVPLAMVASAHAEGGRLAVSAAPVARIQVVDSGPGHVRLLYEADPGDHASPGWSAAMPSLLRDLSRGALVGIPLTGSVAVELVEARQAGSIQAPANRAPLDGLSLGSPVVLGDTGFLRRQRVASVGFGPALGEGGQLEIYDRIVADVVFDSAPSRRVSAAEGRHAEMLYRNAITNYDQSRAWRRSRESRPAAGRSASARPAAIRQDAGDRLRLVVRKEGLYRVTGEDLEEAGIDLSSVNPASVRLQYAGGRMLGRATTVSPGVEPADIGFVLETGGDGRFDEDDYVLFYGEPTERWEYNPGSRRHTFRQNDYTLDNVYWLELGATGDLEAAASRDGTPSASPTLKVSQYRERIHEEDNRFILRQLVGINSGWEWYWEDFQGKARNFSFVIRDALPDPVEIDVHFWGWTGGSHRFDLRWNEGLLGSASFSGSQDASLSRTAAAGAVEGLNQLGVFHLGTELTRLDWIELEYSRLLAARSGELMFDWVDAAVRESGTLATGIVEFTLTGFDGEPPRIFDVANGFAEITGASHDQTTVTFQDQWDGSGRPPRYAVVQSDRWRKPTPVTLDRDSQLTAEGRGADWVVISHGDFLDAAQRLADWRSQDDRFGVPMQTAVVDVQDIYDTFSGGLVDPMAIRSFAKHAAEHWSPSPVYVLLVGDASYDYKNGSGTSHTNWMPAYQDGISMYDEWYVRLDTDILPELAIGRLAVQTSAEADAVVDKIIRYEREPDVGVWRGRNLLVADDLTNPQKPQDYESYFLADAEGLARHLLPYDLDLVKHYLAAYPLEGRTKPQARDEYIRLFNEGNLLVTYLGHGNPETLAHEQMFVLSRDLESIDNGSRWPFMYTAASQVGVFDDPSRQSMPELLLNRADGGVIGFISATRVGFHNSNMVLARQWYGNMFRSEEPHVPVGLALTAAKQIVQPLVDRDSQINIQRYSLLGDPALRLARPRNLVEIEVQDTISALEEVRVRGRVLDADGRSFDDLEGTAWVQVFDSAAGSELEGQPYIQLGAPLFRSQAAVSNGRFEATFRVPKDITYRGSGGRVSAYVWSESGGFGDDNSAFGADGKIVLLGTAEGAEDDEDGPQIELGFAGQAVFRSGDFVSASPVLETAIGDPSGINITGETGHEIVLRLDGEVYEVTRSFSNRDGDYRHGVLVHELPALEPGVHTISLKAWDSYNNSTRVEAEIRVAAEGDDALADLLFYPNPMAGDTGFFTYTLTEPALEARIDVFTLAGTPVGHVKAGADLGYNQVTWSPADELANGTYLYKLSIALQSGAQLERTERIQVVK